MLVLFGGAISYFLLDLIRSNLKINDSLDLFAVHGVRSILGTFMVSFLFSDLFLALPSDNILVKSQLIGVVLIIV